MSVRATALIADDEPLLRRSLKRLLADAWPELQIVAEARNGREAVDLFEARKPEVCFLDVHMPGINGVEAARYLAGRAQLVFVTAFDQYAVKAFEHGALDYLVKPVEPARLAQTVARLQERLHKPASLPDAESLIEQLAARLRKDEAPPPLRWLRVSIGTTVRLIAMDDVDYLRSDEKYTLVAWRGDGGKPAEGLMRTPLKDLIGQLDPERFTQVHRSVVVNLHAISQVNRDGETGHIRLKGREEILPVSRSYLHLFRQM